MLTPKQETYYLLTYSELDRLIQEHFQKPDYTCVAEEEWSNDNVYRVTVRLDWYTEDEREDVQHFINGTKPYQYWSCSVDSLMCELAENEIIPLGNYLIEVCW